MRFCIAARPASGPPCRSPMHQPCYMYTHTHARACMSVHSSIHGYCGSKRLRRHKRTLHGEHVGTAHRENGRREHACAFVLLHDWPQRL